MNCMYLRIRTKDYKKYIYCNHSKRKKEINFKVCKTCKYKEFKQVKELKKKSNKLKKLESKRFSILTDNMQICYICNKARKDDLHEIFEGSNRQNSMKYGLVIPICRKCHDLWKIDIQLKQKVREEAKQKFYKLYSKEKFLEVFGKFYI